MSNLNKENYKRFRNFFPLEMFILVSNFFVFAYVASTMCASRDDWRCAQSMHEFSAKDIDGHMVNLDKYRGFVCIVTNVASQ